MQKIQRISKLLNIPEEYVIPYGHFKAKIDYSYFRRIEKNPDGKLILVTALTPTKVGEGKTTISVALADGLRAIGRNAVLCLREPSLGPVFGLKGGATGGGLISVIPSEDINLHFNGDIHALTSAVNLISAVIDNHIFQGNELGIDVNNILWQRAVDMNDRALRDVIVNNNEKYGGPRKEQYLITVASELMAILCLAKNPTDFRTRIGNIAVAYNKNGNIVYLRDLQIVNAVMKLMKDALNPNLVQTIAGTPAFIHGGPFANIAHGCNSVIANRMALKLGDYVVTEAGFGADLGAEKFFDIHIPALEKRPDACVFVVTLKALKSHGGVEFEKLSEENVERMLVGTANIERHIENIARYGVPTVVALNRFANDHVGELEAFSKWCKARKYDVREVTGFDKGVPGCLAIAQGVVEALETKINKFKTLYSDDELLKDKIHTIATKIYGASDVDYSSAALAKLQRLQDSGFGSLKVCIAKTPLSFSDNPSLINAPKGFTLKVEDILLKTGAGFVVVLCGGIITMPGLPKVPNAVKMESEVLDWIE